MFYFTVYNTIVYSGPLQYLWYGHKDRPIHCKHRSIRDKNDNNVFFTKTLLFMIKNVNITN